MNELLLQVISQVILSAEEDDTTLGNYIIDNLVLLSAYTVERF